LNRYEQYPAVTLTVAKRPGTNASALSELLLQKVEGLRGSLIPSDLNVTVTRDYGETASGKSIATEPIVIAFNFFCFSP